MPSLRLRKNKSSALFGDAIAAPTKCSGDYRAAIDAHATAHEVVARRARHIQLRGFGRIGPAAVRFGKPVYRTLPGERANRLVRCSNHDVGATNRHRPPKIP